MYKTRSLCDTSKISKILSEKVKELKFDIKEKYQLLNLNDDVLLVWCKEDACFIAQILQKHRDADTSSKSADSFQIQMLTLMKPPLWDVKHILSNSSGTGVLLIGKEGIAVVELPKRWGNPPKFEGGIDNITCRVEYIGEQFFTCNPNITVISADWHPGSLNHKCVVVLSSDNYLRIYDLSYLEIPEQAIPLTHSSKLRTESGRLCIEEYAVAFGIGSPLNLEESSNENVSKNLLDDDERRLKFQDLQWPVFILYNNGDVYYVVTSINRKRIKRKILHGPLRMDPPSFDNYGLDYCSLLVLASSPTVLAIANAKGFIHHCIVIENELRITDESLDIQELTESISQLQLEISNISLHVYESVHLNISVADQDSLPFLLILDPNTPARYWVLHSEGVHAVALPLVETFLSKGNEFPEWDLECHVEHFVCTRPIQSVESCPVIGLAISTTPCKIFVLQSSGSIEAIPLPSILIPNGLLLSLDVDSTDSTQLHKKGNKEFFEDRIRSILQREASQPLLLSGSSPEVDAEEYLKYVSDVTDTLRRNYIQPQIKAREEIQRRRNLLQKQNELLQKELKSIDTEKNIAMTTAQELSEKYEVANEKHKNIMKRLEVVIGHLVRKMPILSSNEITMLKELEDKLEKCKSFAVKLAQIKSKHQWQQNQIEKQKLKEELQTQGSSLSDNQLKCLRKTLSEESDRLKNLVSKIKQVKKECGL